MTREKVTALISCYNEGPRIGNVLKVLVASPRIGDVIVVDAASTDNSREIVNKFGCKLIALEKKLGKGEAVRIGMEQVKTKITLLCDADISGLKESHVDELLDPLYRGFVMCIGVREKPGKLKMYVKQKVIRLAGERAMFTEHLNNILKNPKSKDWRLEGTMNYYHHTNKLQFKVIVLKGVNDIPKPFKHGKSGTVEHVRETAVVCKNYAELYLGDYPKEKAKKTRKKAIEKKDEAERVLKKHVRRII
ncbi:MAG: glycosyltransferase [bacterium]|nr:glycosyltransferase [bacterium]